jgi:hypothetical protein
MGGSLEIPTSSNSSERCLPLPILLGGYRSPADHGDCGDRESLFQQGEQLIGTPCVLFAAFQLGDDFSLAAGQLSAVQHKTVSPNQEDESGLTGLGHSIRSTRTAVLAPGTAAKISRSNFHDVWSRSAALRELQVRYSELMLSCAQQTAACNAVHSSDERLCTWLLRAHDLLPGERLPFTQQVLADMIGVRRSTVTFFAHELQNEGILRYTRGHINVMNRAELEHKACECYAITRGCAAGAFHHG